MNEEKQVFEIVKDVFDFLKKELRVIVGAPLLNYLQKEYLKQTKGNKNENI